MKTKKEKALAGVAETLLIPLCYRAVEARQGDPLINDPRLSRKSKGKHTL